MNNGGKGGSVPGRASGSEITAASMDPLLEETETRPYKAYGLSEIVRAFKSFSARRINRLRRMAGIPVWQRNYYDHIIRNQNDLELTWQYIDSNPAQWSADEENLPRLPTGERRGPSS